MANDNGDEKRPLPTNMRRNRQETDKRLLVLVIFMLVVVGGGLIGLIFGWEAVVTAVPCLLGGALLILVPWGLLTLAEKWRDRLDG
ncbi:MAG: hypothetical protein KBE23_08470 [Chloroflexi bacterium]|nr:hypothetical protein [Chloroflexota bacterium]MBP7042766.1 hypothetical protein [Chloroflexota bacterium]